MSDTAQSVETLKLDPDKRYLFYSKFVSPMYDITTKAEHHDKLSFAVAFVNHHADVSAEEAEKLISGRHYNREYWMVKKRIPIVSISSIANNTSASPLDMNIINVARARAEALASAGATPGDVEAEDAELTQVATNRAAIKARIDIGDRPLPFKLPKQFGKKKSSELIPKAPIRVTDLPITQDT